ncbi:hypothetical protein A7X67_03330 [Clostridium sp. W14A]|nr:hypothetical protein A7X67_03330 [Clostridium sp. W14A]
MPYLFSPDGGVNRKIKTLYAPVGGINCKVKSLWEADAGVNRKIYSGGLHVDFSNISVTEWGYNIHGLNQNVEYDIYNVELNADDNGLKYSFTSYHDKHGSADNSYDDGVAILSLPVLLDGQVAIPASSKFFQVNKPMTISSNYKIADAYFSAENNIDYKSGLIVMNPLYFTWNSTGYYYLANDKVSNSVSTEHTLDTLVLRLVFALHTKTTHRQSYNFSGTIFNEDIFINLGSECKPIVFN